MNWQMPEDWAMNPWYSWYPTLALLFNEVPMKRVVETGSGDGTTGFFLSRGSEVVSIESDPDWFAKLRKFELLRHTAHFSDNETDVLKKVDGADFIFIDGRLEYRAESLQHCLDTYKAPVIGVHDTEYRAYTTKYYGWDRVRVPKGWRAVAFCHKAKWAVWTTIFYRTPLDAVGRVLTAIGPIHVETPSEWRKTRHTIAHEARCGNG